MPKNKKINVDIEGKAIQLVKEEKIGWEQGVAFITEKVAFNMRNLIRQLRKNYWGVFDEPYDNGIQKIFVPLTESLVESIVKNIDLDTKDINFRAEHPSLSWAVPLVRAKTRSYLEDTFFGEDLDKMERQLAIDGTAVWKIVEVVENGKKIPKRILVDILNFYIDPTASSIQETPAVIERAVMTPNEIKQMDGWINTEDIKGEEGLDKWDGESMHAANETGKVKMVEVFERWGLMPKSFITGSKDDTELIEGHIVVSGITGKNARVHLIEENTNKVKFKNGETKIVKPYEEAWYTRVAGRWYGRGVAEKVMLLQLWMNTVVNVRINRNRTASLGIFKVKKGKGITPQSISRLPVNGVVTVQDMDDLQQMVVQEATQSSYSEENSAQTWAERVTSAFESVTGETLPSSTTATTSAIQSRSGQSQFVLIKEGLGMFLDRLFKRHILPILTISKEDILEYIGDDQMELENIDEKISEYILNNSLPEQGIIPQESIDMAKEQLMGSLKEFGSVRYMAIDEDIPLSKFNVVIDITNEKIDKGVMIQNLATALNLAPEYREQIIASIFDSMGLNFKPAKKEIMPPMTGQAPQSKTVNPTEVVQEANTI